MKFLELFRTRKTPADPARKPSQVLAILNDAGVLVCTQEASNGAFKSAQVSVPEDWKTTRGPWFVGAAIRLEVRDGALRLGLERTASDDDLVVHAGPKGETNALLAAIRHEWLLANQTGSAGAAAPNVVRHAAPAAQLMGGGWSQRQKFVSATVAAVALFAVGVGATRLYLQPRGPGIDLSSMSVEAVAQLDSNPAVVRGLQDQLMSAVAIGQDSGKKLAGKIEKDHVEALGAMGLQAGVSMQNAMSCLAK